MSFQHHRLPLAILTVGDCGEAMPLLGQRAVRLQADLSGAAVGGTTLDSIKGSVSSDSSSTGTATTGSPEVSHSADVVGVSGRGSAGFVGDTG